MRIKELKVYEFKELSEKAQEKAIQSIAQFALDYEWFESTYNDAENIGLKITGFSDYKATGKFILPAKDVANLILQNHGVTCETYRTADLFLNSWRDIEFKRADAFDKISLRVLEESERDEEELEGEFLKALLEDYRIILNKEADYLTSKECIIETIEANEYEFTEDGWLA